MAAVLWPTEALAQGFQNLDDIRLYVGLSNAALRAIVSRVGDLDNRYTLLASISAASLLQSMNVAQVITVPYVAPDPAANPPVAEVLEQSRRLDPIETAQVGTTWRICSAFCSSGTGRRGQTPF